MASPIARIRFPETWQGCVPSAPPGLLGLPYEPIAGLLKAKPPEEAMCAPDIDVAHALEQPAVPLAHRLGRSIEQATSDSPSTLVFGDQQKGYATDRTMLQRVNDMPGK
jgi:hypothetical protein